MKKRGFQIGDSSRKAFQGAMLEQAKTGVPCLGIDADAQKKKK